MDLRGQEKRIGVGMPISMSFNPPTMPIRESVSTSTSVIGSIGGDDQRRRDGTSTGNGTTSMFSSDHQHRRHQVHQVHQQQHHHHQVHQQQQQQQQQHPVTQPQQVQQQPLGPFPLREEEMSDSDSDSDADLDTDPVPTPYPFPVSVAMTVAGTTSVTPISLGSMAKARPARPRYRECLKNHAASIGGHVVDGCGEFMPSGEDGTLGAFKCAACDCHRNFHRKEVEGEHRSGANCYHCYNTPNDNSNNARRYTNTRVVPQALPAPPQPLGTLPLRAPVGLMQPMMMTFGGGGGGTESSSEEHNVYQSNVGTSQQPPYGISKKRFRTKFSQEQKEKMVGFAEKIGWRFQKQDEELVQQFCVEAGVKRQVLKVWMHNNKHIIKKKD